MARILRVVEILVIIVEVTQEIIQDGILPLVKGVVVEAATTKHTIIE